MASVQKFLTALILSLIGLLNALTGDNTYIDPDIINAIVLLLAPILVYLVPNKVKK